jgi:LAO/AO transport system kinase
VNAAAREILAGNNRAAARLMRDLDDEIPAAIRTLKQLYRHTGRAYILGVTGSPGAGKSTLVNRITTHLRKRGTSVGIVAIDPTSPYSGGAILGDRIRMQQHALDEGVFIKSLATRGHLGGLSRSTIDIVNVMDAMGKDVILIETVGVGQDEVEIVKVAHTNLVLVVPGLADKAKREIETMVSMSNFKEDEWKPPVLSVVAASDKGTVELLDAVDRHKEYIYQEGNLSRYRREKARVELVEILKTRLIEKAVSDLDAHGLLDPLLADMAKKRKDPYTISEKVVNHSFAFHFLDGGKQGSKKEKGKGR